jgi:hypothetical protein
MSDFEAAWEARLQHLDRMADRAFADDPFSQDADDLRWAVMVIRSSSPPHAPTLTKLTQFTIKPDKLDKLDKPAAESRRAGWVWSIR